MKAVRGTLVKVRFSTIYRLKKSNLKDVSSELRLNKMSCPKEWTINLKRNNCWKCYKCISLGKFNKIDKIEKIGLNSSNHKIDF